MAIRQTTILVLERHPMMRESLHLAINMEPDLRVLDTNVESKSPLQLALPNGHDLIFLEQEPDVVLMALLLLAKVAAAKRL